MDMIITPDCPQCHGEGCVPFDRDKPDGFSRRPCGQCCRRWDLANPCPSPKFLKTNMTMAKMMTGLRRTGENIETSLAKAMADSEFREHFLDELRWMLGAAADFIASHDPSTKVRPTEEESPYCNACEFDHVPGECGL